MTPDSPTQRVGAPASSRFQKVEHLTPMGSLEKVTTDEAIVKWAADVDKRLDNGAPVAFVLEPKIDGLAINLTYENGALRPRRDARRRRGRRGRDRQPAHDPVDPAPAARRRRAAAGRGARRGLHAAVRLPRAERAARRRGQEADAEPAQRRRRLAAPEEPGDHREQAALGVGVRRRRARGRRARVALGDARLAEGARLPDQPVRRAGRVGRGGRAGLRRVGAPARRARLRDRRHRDQGRRSRAAAHARLAPLAPALGARVQVGADDRDDAAREDHDPRRPHRRAQPVGDHAARRGRRRRRLARDAAQRGGHQPQGDPRGRRRDRPARRRRDPADRRPGGRAPSRHEAVPHAGALPALRHEDRQAGGRGDASLPEPRLPVARSRVADQLGAGRGRHRRRRRAARAAPLGARARPLAAGALPPDEGAAPRARRLRGDLARPTRSTRSRRRSRSRSGACSSASTSPMSAG